MKQACWGVGRKARIVKKTGNKINDDDCFRESQGAETNNDEGGGSSRGSGEGGTPLFGLSGC